MNKHVVIVGGVAGGATAAAQIRRMDKDIRISIFDKGGHISYSNCGIPYYIGGIVSDRDQILKNSEEFAKEYDVNIHLYAEATEIDRDAQCITYRNAHTGESSQQEYDFLILSPGASARVPDIKGLNAQKSFTVRSIEDMDKINQYLDANSPSAAFIAGGGFIGIEMAENLLHRNMQVSLLERSPQIMGILDSDIAEIMQDEMTSKGVSLLLNDELIAAEDEGKTMVLKSGTKLKTEVVILAMGIIPNTSLAEKAGLEIGTTNGIVSNEYMQTNDPLIYVLGDAAETVDPILHRPKQVPLAWPAHRQAYIIANHITGNPIPYKGTYGSAIVKFGDLAAGMIGHNEKVLKTWNIPFDTSEINAKSHAGYYPGAEQLRIKVHYDRHSREILGAQAIGKDGADKRIDIIAAALRGSLTVDELQEIEIAYAPPFSSPKDPLNIIGYKASAQKR